MGVQSQNSSQHSHLSDLLSKPTTYKPPPLLATEDSKGVTLKRRYFASTGILSKSFHFLIYKLMSDVSFFLP